MRGIAVIRRMQYRVRALASATAVGSAVVLAAGVPSVAADAPTVLGQLVDEGGKPLAGVLVQASVEVDAQRLDALAVGEVSSSTQIGSATTDRNGRFRLKTENMAAVATSADDRGLASVLFAAAPERGGQAYYRVRMQVSPETGRLVAYQDDVNADQDPQWHAELR